MSGTDLQALEPRLIWNLFGEITRIPRCSGKEDKIRGWVKSWGGSGSTRAGLECGVFKGIAPEPEMVSLGPTLRGVHSTDEAIDIPSAGIVWQVVRGITENMDQLGGEP